MKLNLKDFNTLVKTEKLEKSHILTDQSTFDPNNLKSSTVDAFAQPAGAAQGCTIQNIHDEADVIADKYIESVIEIFNDELQKENDADFEIIHKQVGNKISAVTDILAKAIIGGSGLMPDWSEQLRQYKKALAKDIRKLKEDCKDEAITWANMTASMSRDWGADAPYVAGLSWIVNKAGEWVSNKFEDATVETGRIVEQFARDNFTEAIQEKLGL